MVKKYKMHPKLGQLGRRQKQRSGLHKIAGDVCGARAQSSLFPRLLNNTQMCRYQVVSFVKQS